MRHRLAGNHSGYTLIELVIAAGLLSLVLVSTMVLLVTMLNMWNQGSSGTSANSNAGLGMRKLVLDIEEGRSAYVTTNGQLRVVFPYYDTAAGKYEKTQTGTTATYYLSGPNGTEISGDRYYLWKSVGTSRTMLSKNVSDVTFSVTNGVLVRINMKGRDPEGGAITPNYVQQSVKLRNS